jgi:hypothetical protein
MEELSALVPECLSEKGDNSQPGATGGLSASATANNSRPGATARRGEPCDGQPLPTGCHWPVLSARLYLAPGEYTGGRMPNLVTLANHRVTQRQRVTMPPALS